MEEQTSNGRAVTNVIRQSSQLGLPLVIPQGGSLSQLRFLLSVQNDNNDYQIEQVKSARQAAAKVGVDLEVTCAQDDGILQSQQLLRHIQSGPESYLNVIIFEPAGSTTLPHVARAAAGKRIGWVVLSRHADYVSELRSIFRIPAFVVAADHAEIGRIQGRQAAALLPDGGIVLAFMVPLTASQLAFAIPVCWRQNPKIFNCA